MLPDDALKAKLAQLPPEAEHFWYGPHGEVRSANPNQAALPSGAPRKRKRAELKKERAAPVIDSTTQCPLE